MIVIGLGSVALTMVIQMFWRYRDLSEDLSVSQSLLAVQTASPLLFDTSMIRDLPETRAILFSIHD